MAVQVLYKDLLKEWAGGAEDDLVCLNLDLIHAGKSDISEVGVHVKTFKSIAGALVEFFPRQGHLSTCFHLQNINKSKTLSQMKMLMYT